MKKIILICSVLTVLATIAQAQQKPQYTQYVFDNYLLNPAVTGIENYTDLKTGYRSQWSGLQGAPVTSFLSINAPIGRDFIEGAASNMPRGGDMTPMSRLYTQEYMASEPHHGIGLMVISDKTGPITQGTISASYAYHLGLSPKLNLAFGVSAGVNHVSLNTAEITLPDVQVDQSINNGVNSEWKPDLGAGLWLYGPNFYMGASAQQLLQQNFYLFRETAGNGSTSVDKIRTIPHYFFTTGVKLFLSDDLALMPSVLVKVINPIPTTFDVNMKMSFRDVFWFGGSYRKDDSFAILAGFNINATINVGYSYDITTSALNTVSNGTHEIILGIPLNNRNKVRSPMHGF